MGAFRRWLVHMPIGFGVVAGCGSIGLKYINDEIDDLVYDTKKALSLDSIFGVRTGGSKNKDVKKQKVVILGTGWAGLSMMRHLDQDLVDVKVISPRTHFFYTPLLAGAAVGTVRQPSIMEPIRWYLDDERRAFIQGEVSTVDFDNQNVICQSTAGCNVTVPYDELIIAVGAEPATFNISGVKEHAFFMKELKDSIQVQRRIQQCLEQASALMAAQGSDADIDALLSWVVVGGGPTGVELTAELSDFVKSDIQRFFPHLAPRIKLTLIEATGQILGTFTTATAAFATTTLEDRGANVLLNTFVTKITPNAVSIKAKDLATNEMASKEMASGLVVWAAGIAPRPLVKEMIQNIGSDVQSSRFGLLVDKKFRVLGLNNVWALGDCAVSGCGPTAQAATQAGTFLGRLFRDSGLDKDLIESAPDFVYKNKGALAYVGGSKGVAELKNVLWTANAGSAIKRGGDAEAEDGYDVEGAGAFAIWRTLYFSKLLSGRNMINVLFDWGKTSLSGRDISSPDFEYLSSDDPKPK